jgi:hypothetical protein
MNGSITKREKNGKPSWGYYFAFGRDEAGKRLQVTKSGFRTKGEADDALQVAIAEHKAKRDAVPVQAVPTFAAFFDRWMNEHVNRKCAPKTIERYRELGAYAICEAVEIGGKCLTAGEVQIDAFGPMQLQLLVNALSDHGGKKTPEFPNGRPLSPKSIRNVAGVVHGCFEKAVLWQLIGRNPMDGIELPKPEKKRPMLSNGRPPRSCWDAPAVHASIRSSCSPWRRGRGAASFSRCYGRMWISKPASCRFRNPSSRPKPDCVSRERSPRGRDSSRCQRRRSARYRRTGPSRTATANCSGLPT